MYEIPCIIYSAVPLLFDVLLIMYLGTIVRDYFNLSSFGNFPIHLRLLLIIYADSRTDTIFKLKLYRYYIFII